MLISEISFIFSNIKFINKKRLFIKRVNTLFLSLSVTYVKTSKVINKPESYFHKCCCWFVVLFRRIKVSSEF